ncbi:DUF6157 family protein [Siphonobacter sp. SORGH_AS_1065]|uniref:DUF6157 family protein n=1 Tax=Siphonobacter sp. SORGH_AS_1065 TaxID=3041795 RepID=UPI00277ED543|nr:DUF6157 family protein [Siphonobacter sp. SORGH_AS_1065]MDQ1089120.1 hypothetical protein [Siphonobacter sp. SORGH_AS_1065]
MKTHSTNYFDTFIEVAEDTKASQGTVPPCKNGKKTVAYLQYELIAGHPYQYTSDDVLFQIYAERNAIAEADYSAAREQFFSKGQPCFRASPLTKTYGFGVHSNKEGKMAVYGLESPEYEQLVSDEKIKKVKAMKATK